MRPELRRDAPADLSTVGEDEALVERIRDEIRGAGPMPFARFMWLCLYEPDGGYYIAGEGRPGRAGDFITAPELHPIFGATLSGLAVETWQRLGEPDQLTVREYGAGTGAMAVSMLDALRASPMWGHLRYQPIEAPGRPLDAVRARLMDAGLGGLVDEATDPVEPIVGVVLANEVLDALPVHRVRQRGSALWEVALDVGPDGVFTEIEIDPSTPAIAERLAADGLTLVDGQTAEVCLAIDEWIPRAGAGLARGLLVLIDYGAPAAELYDPVRRRDGTLRAYVRHQVHDDPYRHIGRQDLTAHVDVTAVERAAHRAGLTTVGTTTQSRALIGLGIEDRLRDIQADPATTMEDYLLVRASLMRLLDPAAMGRFRFMGFGRDWPDGPPLGAFVDPAPEGSRPPRTAPD